MKLIIEPTDEMVSGNLGIRCRTWRGRDQQGRMVVVYVAVVALDAVECTPQSTFDDEVDAAARLNNGRARVNLGL